MTDQRTYRLTHLFTVRLWIEPGAPQRASVRGRVEHVLSGNVRYVASLRELAAHLEGMLERLDTSASNNRTT